VRSLSTACAVLLAAAVLHAREPVVGLPCEGCEDVFVGMPSDLAAIARIAPASEPGAPMRIEGTVRDGASRPVAGVIVYAYHTDDRGIYPPMPSTAPERTRHGRLRAWARTDEHGRYRFDTIRPAGYPGTEIPAHVHMHVIEPGRCTYFIGDIQFTDDTRLNSRERERAAAGPGGNGLVTPRRGQDGVWLVRRDIVLGERVPGYPSAPRRE
jgi:protocatechuate 3,4-dioxygenase beta subunit